MSENQKAIAARCPSEVLAGIFQQAVDVSESDRYRRGRRAYEWLPVTQVCERWRSTALGFPKIWSYIVVLNPEWMQVCLERSHTVPIHVNLRIHREPSVIRKRLDALVIALQHFPGIRTLCLDLPTGSYEYLAPLGDLNLQRYLLESVEIDVSQCVQHAKELVDLFTQNTPVLHTLKTRGHPSIWRTTTFTATLKHLHVSLARYHDGIGPILDALSNTPLLETFGVVDLPQAYTIPPDELPIVDRVVTLSHLQSMDLDAAASDVARFLYHISFPASTRLVINCEPVNLEQEPKSLALAISARLKNPCTSGPSRTVTPFQSVALFMQEFHIFRKFLLYAWRSVLSSSDLSDTERNEEPAIQPDLQVIFQASIDDSRHNDRSVAGFCQYLPMPDAQVVYVGSTRLKDPKDSASKAFRSMDRVHTLEITEAAAKAMPSLLQSDPTFFPVLTNLRLSTVRMTGPDATPAHFVETLKARRDKGLGIKHLTITDCVVKSADVDSFREVVEEVVWDELETPDDGLEDNFEEEEEEAIEEDE